MYYLDCNATTCVAPAVLDAMLPWFTDHFGNAASVHAPGRAAAAAVATARTQVAEAIGARPCQVVFTSGSTEANNLALRGVSERVVCPAAEHKAVLDTVRSLGGVVVAVDGTGRVDVGALEAACDGAALVSVMLANNETGVLNDLEAVVAVGHAAGCLVHSDMTQALGKIPVDVTELGLDLASFSAHKLHGPKGVGALFVARRTLLTSTITGGGHEGGVRSGTLNVPGIVGFGAACALEPAAPGAVAGVAGRLLEILEAAGGVEVFSDHTRGLPNTLSVRFVGVDGEALMAQCPEVAMSVGSACTAAVPEPSHVLAAMGVPGPAAFETVRLSIDACTTVADAEVAGRLIVAAVDRVRGYARSAPVPGMVGS